VQIEKRLQKFTKKITLLLFDSLNISFLHNGIRKKIVKWSVLVLGLKNGISLKN